MGSRGRVQAGGGGPGEEISFKCAALRLEKEATLRI